MEGFTFAKVGITKAIKIFARRVFERVAPFEIWVFEASFFSANRINLTGKKQTAFSKLTVRNSLFNTLVYLQRYSQIRERGLS